MLKVIMITSAATLAVVTLVASMFLNSILSAFGLVSTSIDTFNSLQENKQIIDIVKSRHKEKEINISKRFASRTGKKVASSAVSAATIGTAAVVITIAALEVIDYCDQKEELHDDGNVLFKTNKEFNYAECINDAKDDTTEIIISVKNAVPEVVGKAWEDTKGISRDTWEATKMISINTWSSTSKAAASAWSSTSEKTNKAIEILIDWAAKLSQ